MNEYLPLSVVILTKNEAKRVEKAVDSVSSICQELIVVDSFSSDKTLDIVKAAWARAGRDPKDLKIWVQAWKGFTVTRNESIQLSSCDWILWLDADEYLDSDKFRNWMNAFLSESRLVSAVRFARQSQYMGKWIRHGGWYPDYKLRMLKRGEGVWKSGVEGADLHEDLVATNQKPFFTAPRKVQLSHVPFMNIQEHRETNLRYSKILARSLYKKRVSKNKGKISQFEVWVKCVVKFVENYIFKAGFLDGYPGYVIARESSQSMKWRCQEANLLFSNQGGH